MNSAPHVLYEVERHVAKIELNRPERLNAMSRAMMDDVGRLVLEASNDSDVWVLVITAAGDRSFSVGGDLKEMNDDAEGNERFPHPMKLERRNQFEILAECPKPTIAAVNGYALAGGCELALACDLRLAVAHAEFGLLEAKRGLGANFGSVMLHRVVPRAVAFEMLYTAKRFSAQFAERWGLVNRVVGSVGELRQETESLCRQLLENAPLSLQRYKAVAVKGRELPLSAALRLDPAPIPYDTEDRVEGIRAFIEKRPPEWKGR